MDIQPQTTQPISDDQELAKVLAGVNKQADEAAELEASTLQANMAQTVPAPVSSSAPTTAVNTDMPDPVASMPTPQMPDLNPAPAQPAVTTPSLPNFEATSSDEGLEDVKKDAISELKPLVDKLTNLPAEEKFDLYLLLIRSTDDPALIAPAHEAAKNITDEERKAQALLDIIKEIDYLSSGKKGENPLD